MSRKRIVFGLICILLWPAGILVSSEMQGPVSYLVWWFATHAGSTHLPLLMFKVNSLLPLAFVEGFLLGLVPIDRLRSWLASSFARFQHREPTTPTSELDPTRPLLWVWVLPTCLFLLRFITWSPTQGHSVLLDSATGTTRLVYFFGNLSYYSMTLDTLSWGSDRIFITSPVFFFVAYPAAVLLRHRLVPYNPMSSSGDALIHSAPDPNSTEPTENPAKYGSPE